MKIKVLFFGATAEAVGEREIEVEIAAGTKAERVFDEVLERFPQLRKSFPKSLLFAVNQEYASGDEIVGNNDELAIFTAVSGG